MDKKIKTCHLTTVDITIRFIIFNFLKHLQQNNYDIYVVCSPGEWVSSLNEGFSFRGIEMTRKITPIKDLISFIKLFFYFKKEKFDIVHTYTPKAGILGRIAARLAGVPVVVHTSFGFYMGSQIPPRIRKTVLFAEKIASHFCDLVFSQNEEDIGFAIKEKIINSNKIELLRYGIDMDRFNPSNFSQDDIFKRKKELGIENKKVIGMVGRFLKEKGYLDLFEAFKIVKNKIPDAVLLLVAPLDKAKRDALDYSILKDYGIEKDVVLFGDKGVVNNTEEIYSLMDVFVLPSYREGLSYSIIEASAFEKPIVASDIRGCRESVDNGKTGILVPPKSPTDFANALISLLNDQRKCRELGRSGREKVLREFDEKITFAYLRKKYNYLARIKVCWIVSVDITLKFMLFNQLKFLQSQGYNVSAVCSPGKWVKDIEANGIKVKEISFKRKISPFSDIISFISLYFYLRKEKFQIVHAHTLKPQFYGQIAARLAGVPIVINTLHGFDFSDDAPYLRKRFFIFLKKIIAKHSDLIFSISRAVINTLIKEKICQPELLRYLGRDIDTDKFNPKRFSEEFILDKKRQLGIGQNQKVIGIVARLVREKGYLELFEAFKKVLKKFPGALLLIVGQKEPEKKDAINPDIVREYGIEKNVLFLGERADADEIYSLIDVFVLPSHREGLGAATLEASATEKPVIVSSTGGCLEAVDDGKTGILVPVRNAEKLYEAIMYLFDNPEKAKKMGELGREKVIREFNEKLIFDRMKTEYNCLIKKKL
jgi:glycosyltransferase involved in cell wall biosynthesis